MSLATHRLKEQLGGVVSLLTIDASIVSGNPLHLKRYCNVTDATGNGIVYQGNTYEVRPYEVAAVNRSTKSSKSNVKIAIGDLDLEFSRFIEDVGATGIIGARIFELRVYERFLDGGIEANVSAFVSRFDHLINMTQDSGKIGEIEILTIDPLSRSIKVPSQQFSSGIPNSGDYSMNVFPAVDRRIANTARTKNG